MFTYLNNGYWLRAEYDNAVECFSDTSGKWFTVMPASTPITERENVLRLFAEALDRRNQQLTGAGMVCISQDNYLGLPTTPLLFFGGDADKEALLQLLGEVSGELGRKDYWCWKSNAQTKQDWEPGGVLDTLRRKQEAREAMAPIREALAQQGSLIGERLYRLGYQHALLAAHPALRGHPSLQRFCSDTPLDRAVTPPWETDVPAPFMPALQKLQSVLSEDPRAFDELCRLMDMLATAPAN